MDERIVVFVNDKPVELYRGMHVEHALIACGGGLHEAARHGEIMVEDENGFRVGLQGSLRSGARIYTRHREERRTKQGGEKKP
jgi:hypothetical protein